MITLHHVYKSFSDKVILKDTSLSVNSGEVIALIGDNGVGKTTLLNMLIGTIKPDSGSISTDGEVLGYIPQETLLGRTVRESFNQTTEMWRINYALAQVNLTVSMDSLVISLSGGQKTRLAFAKVLANDPEPSVLLMDEPTNNLDTEGIRWLRNFINDYQGAIMLVSHDRAFINAVASRTIELKDAKLSHYGGNYDFYRQQKATEDRSKMELYQQNIDERNRLKKAIRQQRELGKHTHNHIKRPDGDKYQRDFFRNRVTNKFGQQTRSLEKRLEQLDIIEPPESSRHYKVLLSGKVPSQKLLLRLKSICKNYNKSVLTNVDLEIRGNERLHITGSNGSGKTTLLKIAAGVENPDQGTVTIGVNVSIGYFSQEVDGLDHNSSALENLEDYLTDPTSLFREARSLGLTKQDLSKRISELSRGQQAKLGFAKLLLGSHQLLILDEPTNHLDIKTREQIEAALQEYKGAILVASHDTFFINALGVSRRLSLE